MLYVDADNDAGASRLYDALGFTVHAPTDRGRTTPARRRPVTEPWRPHPLRRRPRAELADAARRRARATASTRCGTGSTRSCAAPERADHPARRRCARGSPTSCPLALDAASPSRRATTATRSSGCGRSHDGAQVETVLMHYPDRATVCVSHPGRLRDGVRVLRHRPGRLRPPPHDRRDRRAGGAGAAARRAATRPRGCRTSCSWAWASRSPTTTAPGRAVERIHDDLGLVGPPPHAVDRRHRARHPPPRRRGRCPVNLAVSLHAANDALPRRAGARSTGATRSTCSTAACARLPRGQGPAAVASSGR